MTSFNPSDSSIALPALWAAFLTLLIAGPWLLPGYLFGTDWPGFRRIPFPTDFVSFAPLQWLLAATSSVVGGELTGKLLVFAMLTSAAWLAYWAAPTADVVARAAASTIYVVNPFVYGRLHYGQLFLLAGYAALPWVVIRFRQLILNPRPLSAILAAVSLALVGALSIHLSLVAALLCGALLVAHVFAVDRTFDYLTRLAPNLLITAACTLAASAYWVIPVVLGRGREGKLIAGIGSSDLAAFASVPDAQLGLVPNLLGLYGFWAEGTGRFTSMKEFVPIWPAVLAAILLVAAVGATSGLRQHKGQLAAWVAGLLLAAFIALILEMGVSNPLSAVIVKWLDTNFVPYRGMRDSGKWAAGLAFVYSQLVALGVAAILARFRERLRPRPRAEWAATVATGLLIALPLYYGNGLLFGMHGEIKPSQYPSGWYAADRVLAADKSRGRTLFLPWHEYMSYTFVHNQNSVIAPPATSFFSVPVLVSGDPEVPGIAAPDNRDQATVSSLVAAGAHGHWSESLAALGIKYVLLAREVDWRSYLYLDKQTNLVRVEDFGSVVLYRITLERD